MPLFRVLAAAGSAYPTSCICAPFAPKVAGIRSGSKSELIQLGRHVSSILEIGRRDPPFDWCQEARQEPTLLFIVIIGLGATSAFPAQPARRMVRQTREQRCP